MVSQDPKNAEEAYRIEPRLLSAVIWNLTSYATMEYITL
jgi:hypothetical protein